VTEEGTGQAHRRTVQMLADPELGGDLLLVGLALAGLLDLGAPRGGERVRLGDVAKLAWPRSPGTRYILGRVLAGDARTYRAPEPSFGEDRCTAPMLRRPGTCGRARSCYGYLTDWVTGEQNWIVACTRRGGWWNAQRAENEAARPARPPVPAANHGGVLARHFPEPPWPQVWTWATGGTWFEHPEEQPWPRPSLTLYVGDGGDEDGDDELTGDVDDVPADHPRPACARERMTLVAVPTGDRP
jgi:hypothetical protein